MTRIILQLSLLLPYGLLALFWAFPDLDRAWEVPLLHFYLVTFFTSAGVVAALLAALSLDKQSAPRHRLLATAFVAMAFIFLVHGLTTPGAITFSFNPGIRWAAWLTLFIGGVIFALASLDRPGRPLQVGQLRLVHGSLGVFCGTFALIVAFAPDWLSSVDAQASPWHQQLVYAVTGAFWAFAAFRLWRVYRSTGNAVDQAMALAAAWNLAGTISLHGFAVWRLGWWLYHVLLLVGAAGAIAVLALNYERLRRFQLTTYFAVVGLVVAAGLALIESHLTSSFFERNLEGLVSAESIVPGIIRARVYGLLTAGLTTGALYVLLLVVIRRADNLVTSRSQQLAKAYADLQAAEAMRDDLTGMIIHDLRSPLTAISLNLDLLDQGVDRTGRSEVSQSRFVSNAKASVENMLHLIGQLLDVARLEAGQIQLTRVLVDLRPILEQRCSSFRPLAEADEKSIVVDVEVALPRIAVDRDLIGRVFDNLIGNAIRHTDVGGHIVIKASSMDHTVLVEVIDDGEGIDAKALPHIFDKFYQVRESERDKAQARQGSGLGLSFCKLAIEAHQGRIWVDSTAGKGSVFSVLLPLTAGD